MEQLNLPAYAFKIKVERETEYIFDEVRKKFLVLSPEEWVRQHFVQYLIMQKNTPKSLIAIEYYFKLNDLKRRSDIVVFNKQGNPVLIVECKASHIKIDQKVFDQIAQYNLKLKVAYLVVSNGITHYACKIDQENKSYEFMNDIPDFKDYA